MAPSKTKSPSPAATKAKSAAHSSATKTQAAQSHADEKHKDAASGPAFVHGAFCWNELITSDVARAKAFYAATLGWEFDSMPMADGGTYWFIKKPGHPMGLGGVLDVSGRDHQGMHDQWVPYVGVANVDACFKDAIGNGAKGMMEPYDIPNVGRIASIRAPGGAMIYWMTPMPKG